MTRPGSVDAPPDLRLVLPAVSAWAAAFVAIGLTGAWPVPGVLAAVLTAAGGCVAAAALAWRRGRLGLAPTLLCVGAAAATAALRVVALHAGPVDDWAGDQAVVRVDLLVTGDPRRHATATRGTEAGRELYLVPARLERAAARGADLRLRSPVLVLASDRAWEALLPGQRVTASGRLGPARPGQALAAVLTVRGPPARVGRPPAWQRATGDLRAGLRSAVDGLSPERRGLVPGLVLGDTSRMPAPLEDDFRTAGMTHLTAVSGANLVIVAGFVLYVGRWLGVRGRWLPLLGGAAMAGFVVLARPQPSVLRAAAMALVGLVALATGRRRGSIAALAAAMLALLLVDPWLARSYGFALSVLATAGLLVLAPGWAAWLRARGVPWPVAHALGVPAAAQAACAPVVVLLSGQVSLVAVPANLLAGPAVPPATVLGVLAAVVAPVSSPAAGLLGWAAGVPAGWIVFVAEHAAAFPAGALPWPSSAVGGIVLATVLVAAAALGRRLARRPGRLVSVVVAVLVAWAVLAGRPGWPPDGWLLVACDVGQGDALVLSAGPAGAVVVDAGPDPRLVDRCLRDLGVRRLPLVVLTHLHADHVEGLPGLLRGREVGEVRIGPYDEPAAELDRVRRWTRQARVPLSRAVVGERGRLGPLSWEVLWPARVIEGEGSAPNNASLVLLARRDGVRMLLTGDVEPAAQRALLARWRPSPVQVLKVAHHGSAYQAGELLAAVRPRIALVSVGQDNDYGHPARSTLRRLAVLGALVGRTDHDGPLAVVGPAARLRLVTGGR